MEVLDLLPRRPFLVGDKDIRLSLAGAQQKLPVVLINGKVAVPAPGQPSTHILKPPITRFSGSTENEAFAMRLSAALNLNVAAVKPRRVKDRPYLLIERYDRNVAADGAIQRLHQEDFCQALCIPPERKYAAEGGPIFRDCFGLVKQACTPPAPATLGLVDAAIFNVLVGNADAHGKNYSLLYQSNGIVLAPLYDLMCTAAYPEVHAKLAMQVGKRARLEEFTPDTWDDFANEVEVGAPLRPAPRAAVRGPGVGRHTGCGRHYRRRGLWWGRPEPFRRSGGRARSDLGVDQ